MTRGGVAKAGGALLLCAVGGAGLSWHDGILASWLPTAEASTSLPPVGAAAPEAGLAITALGRLEPKDGVRRVAGPALMVAVVERLLVEKGDRVEHGQVIALLDGTGVREAEVARARARLTHAEAELERHQQLHRDDVISDSKHDELRLRRDVARAELQRARAELERNQVRAPIDGQVLDVHARDGERVENDGIVELGRTQDMYAVAEVYETDAGRVRIGQHATVRSPALPRRLEGKVDRVGLKVGKLDALGTDPAARTDARVVEVEIRLEPQASELAAALTHLQVEIEIEP
jgi:HlyD family secretion protein